MKQFTRRIIIEKQKNNSTIIFPHTEKGIKEAYLFFESVGGLHMFFQGLTYPDHYYVVKRANQVWHDFNNHTITYLKEASKQY